MSAGTQPSPGGAGLLASYDPGGFYCEMFGRRGLAHTRKIRERLDALEIGALRRRAEDAKRELFNLGITFTVYTERDAIDRILPFDVIPRILSAKDWETIEAGVKQRVAAINLFLHDVYHRQRIVADGVVPEDLIRGNANFRPEMRDFAVPRGTYVHICGIDVVRDETGAFRVLEDNARTPSGVSYVVENRLLAAVGPSVSATYLYDPRGRRVKKSGSGVTATAFLSDGSEEIAEYGATGNLLRRYVPGPGTDQPVVMIPNVGARRFFHADRQGSVIATSNDSTGARSEGPYTYDPYGNTSSATGVAFKYTGRRLDPETGLYYYRARYYSAALGRFLQTDPVGYADSMNLYAYAGNDPVNNLDPFGLECYDVKEGNSFCDTEAEIVDKIKTDVGGQDDAHEVEYGGYITSETRAVTDSEGNEKSVDGFTYTMERGTENTVDPGPVPENAVAGWHSHPNDFTQPSRALRFGAGWVPDRYVDDVGDVARVYSTQIPEYIIAPGTMQHRRVDPSEVTRVVPGVLKYECEGCKY